MLYVNYISIVLGEKKKEIKPTADFSEIGRFIYYLNATEKNVGKGGRLKMLQNRGENWVGENSRGGERLWKRYLKKKEEGVCCRREIQVCRRRLWAQMQNMEYCDQDILTKFKNNRSLYDSLKTSAQAGTFFQIRSFEGLPSPKKRLSWTHHCPSSITKVGEIDSNRFFKSG